MNSYISVAASTLSGSLMKHYVGIPGYGPGSVDLHIRAVRRVHPNFTTETSVQQNKLQVMLKL